MSAVQDSGGPGTALSRLLTVPGAQYASPGDSGNPSAWHLALEYVTGSASGAYWPTTEVDRGFVGSAITLPADVTIDGNLTVTGTTDVPGGTVPGGPGGGDLAGTYPDPVVEHLSGLLPTGDPTGAGDTALIQDALNALSAGGTAYLGAGTFVVNGTLTLSTPGTSLAGQGSAVTTLTNGSGTWSGSAWVAVTGQYCHVTGLQVTGASPSYGSNPAADAVTVTGAKNCTVDDLLAYYINGYALRVIGTTAAADIAGIFTRIKGYNSANGVEVMGVSGSSPAYGAQCFFDEVQIGQCAGNCWLIQDAQDVLIGRTNCSYLTGGGSAMVIQGDCSSVGVLFPDMGGFSGTPTAPVLLIQDSGGHSPQHIDIGFGPLQKGLYGCQITGGANQVTFHGTRFRQNYSSGMVSSGTGFDVKLAACLFGGNGTGSGTCYDLQWTGASTCYVSDTSFNSSGVTNPCNLNTSVFLHHCDFGGGFSAANVFAAGGTPYSIADSHDYNPLGPVTVAVPASNSPTPALWVSSTFYVTSAGAAGCTITLSNSLTVTIPISVLATITVPAGVTVKPVYTTGNAPTWVVWGN